MTPSAYRLEELQQQTLHLAADLPGLLRDAWADAQDALPYAADLRLVIALGSGDSLHAAQACELAFIREGSVDYRPMSAPEFMCFPPPPSMTESARTAVIGISASGGNPSIVAALTAARERGHRTVAVTSAADSPLSAAAETTVCSRLGTMERSPGIRTYQASLVTLLCLAGRSGASCPAGPADFAAPERLAAAIRRSVAMARSEVAWLADALAAAPVAVVSSLGPALGTARHVAAKLTETAALPAMAVDLEDWWHVHRFGHDPNIPVIFIATPGRARDEVLRTARRTADRRPVVLVAAEDDEEAAGIGVGRIPVSADVTEACRPLVDHAFAGLLAAELAQRRGVLPFSNP